MIFNTKNIGRLKLFVIFADEKKEGPFENKLGTHILMLRFSLCALSGNEKLIFKNIKICHK